VEPARLGVLERQAKEMPADQATHQARIMAAAGAGALLLLAIMVRLCLAVTVVAAQAHQFQAQAQATLAAAVRLFTIQRLAVLLVLAVLEAAALELRQQAQLAYMA
jgi:hypothetical protein